MDNPPINNAESDTIETHEGAINFLLFTQTNTAKVVSSPNSTGQITIKTFITHNSINYTVQEIDDKAFSDTLIESLSFEPNSQVKRIGNFAFQDSTITKIDIPNSLEEFGDNWSYEARNLTDITINTDHEYFSYKNGLLTTKDEHDIIFANRDISNIIFPSEAKKILPFAFYSCQQLTSFKHKLSKIESIGPYAFSECKNLQNIVISDGDFEDLQIQRQRSNLTIGEKCFSFCENLLNIVIECGSLILGDNCFECCTSISGLAFPVKNVSFGQGSISGCERLSSVCIPNAENIEIEHKSFISLHRLNSIYFKTDKFTIYIDSFEDCTLISKLHFEANNIVHLDFLKSFDSLTTINLISHSNLTIKNYYFSKMKELKKINLKSKELILEDTCFNDLENLSSIRIKCENEMNFTHKLFKGCNKLKSFKIIKAKAFNRSEKINLDEKCFCDIKSLEEIEIIADNINIGNLCFYCLKNLKKVAFHGKNVTIGENSFAECDSIESLIIAELEGNGVTEKIDISKESFNKTMKLIEVDFIANDINLGINCFSNSNGLQKVALKCKNANLLDNCFSECSSIKSLIISALNEDDTLGEINLANKCFYKAENLTVINISTTNNININSCCFSGSTNLKTISLYGKNITIGDNCFTECNSLQSFIISEMNENISKIEKVNIEEKCFFNSNLKEVNITANDINLGSNCFSGSKNLKTISLHGKNINIGDNCFTECNSIKSFKTPPFGTEKINLAEKCFFNSNLKEVNIKAININFGNSCFSHSTNLQKVFIHGQILTMGENCFTECNSFYSLVVTDLLETGTIDEINLGKECFYNLQGLKNFEINAKKIIVGDNCFTGSTKLQKVLINGSKVKISNQCFNNCNSLQSFTIKYTLSISIGSQQFNQCDKLKSISITFPEDSPIFALKEFYLGDDCFTGAKNLDRFEIHGERMIISNELLNTSSISSLFIISIKNVEINQGCFNDSEKLKKIDIYSNYLTVNENCFNRINNLQNVFLNCSNIDFHPNCFNYINNCKSIQFSKVNHMTFYSDDFCYWTNIRNLEIEASNTLDIGPKCFIQLEKLETLSFFSTKVTIGSESFNECTSLKNVSLVPKSDHNFKDIAKSLTNDISYIESIQIGDKSFNLCTNMEELKICATGEVIFCDECFYNLTNLYIIRINAPPVKLGKNSFYKCPGLSNQIPVNESENNNSRINLTYIMKNLEKYGQQTNTQFKNDRKFDSFYVFGINRYSRKPSYISMFPATPVTLCDEDIRYLPSFCYPQGIKPVPSKLPNRTNIISGFVFYIGFNKYIGVALHIYIPPSANSFVGTQYDRSYPFCICLISSNPDIASHFSFLYDIVDPIIGKTTLPEEQFTLPDTLRKRHGKCIMFLHMKPNSDCIALAPLANSMNFLLPKLVKYYDGPFLKYIQNDFLVYPTLQTLFTYLSPRLIVELFFCLICDLKIVFLSNDLNKLSFSIIALTNLVKDIDIKLIFPCLPSIYDGIIENIVPCIIGYNRSHNINDIDVNLDTGEIVPRIIDGKDMYSPIHNFVNDTELGDKAESLFNENLNNFLIPEKGLLSSNKFSEFINNADNDIYPECFQFFAQTKYILTKKFIKEFSVLIKKPFFPMIESFIRNYLIQKKNNPDENISVLDFVDEEYKNIMSIFEDSQTFQHICEKIEQQINVIKNETEPQIEIDFPIQPLVRSSSCPSFQRDKLNTPKSKIKTKLNH